MKKLSNTVQKAKLTFAYVLNQITSTCCVKIGVIESIHSTKLILVILFFHLFLHQIFSTSISIALCVGNKEMVLMGSK